MYNLQTRQAVGPKVGVLTVILWAVCAPSWAVPPNGYYAPAAELTGNALRGALHEVIVNHEVFPYSSAQFDVRDAVEALDEVEADDRRVQLLYSDATASKASWPAFNREHVWPVSLGSTHGTPAYTDLHHIFACDANVNSARGNRPFDDCNGDCNTHREAPDAFYTARAWEPPDHQKGDVARALFYMDVRYEGDLAGEPDLRLVEWGVNAGCNCMGRLSKLRRWHEMDPVDDRERRRNEAVFAMQQNRNPFIDNPEWVELIYDAANAGVDPGLSIFDPHRVGPWINELHYDNAGVDQNEGIEIAGLSDTNLVGWTVMLYNGRDGRAYAELGLEGRIDDEGLGYGALWFPFPNLQNGGADAMALIDPLGQVVEFISYEGSTRALDGPAIKRTSTDIGVAEDSDSPAGISLQRVGTGVNGDDFGWAAAMASPGLLNPAQVIFRPIRFPLSVQIGHNFNFSF